MKIRCLLICSFTFQMTPKHENMKYVDQEKQHVFSCKHESTLKTMEFSESDEQLSLLTVRQHFLSYMKNSCSYSTLYYLYSTLYKKEQVGKDQEKAQSEKDSHSKNRGGKKPN